MKLSTRHTDPLWFCPLLLLPHISELFAGPGRNPPLLHPRHLNRLLILEHSLSPFFNRITLLHPSCFSLAIPSLTTLYHDWPPQPRLVLMFLLCAPITTIRENLDDLLTNLFLLLDHKLLTARPESASLFCSRHLANSRYSINISELMSSRNPILKAFTTNKLIPQAHQANCSSRT